MEKKNNIYIVGDLHNDVFCIKNPDGSIIEESDAQYGGVNFIKNVFNRNEALCEIAEIKSDFTRVPAENEKIEMPNKLELGKLFNYNWVVNNFTNSDDKKNKQNISVTYRCENRLNVEKSLSKSNEIVFFDIEEFDKALNERNKNNFFLMECTGSIEDDEKSGAVYETFFNKNVEIDSIFQKILKVTSKSYPSLFWILHSDIPNIIGKKQLNLSPELKKSSVLFLNANSLRKKKVNIGRHVAWESTAQDYIRELFTNPIFSEIKGFSHVVTRFGITGAVYSYRLGNTRWLHRLIFCPFTKKTGFYRDVSTQGDVIGYQTIFATCVINQIISSVNKKNNIDQVIITENICEGLKKAITCCKEIYDKGLGNDIKKWDEHFFEACGKTFNSNVENKNWQTIADVRIPVANAGWSILVQSAEYKLLDIATKLVLKSINHAINNTGGNKDPLEITLAPIIQFKKLTVIDKREIESYLVIHGLLSRAITEGTDKILSIAVFGPPGSGKSFTVEQLTESSHRDDKVNPKFKTINMTKIKDQIDLENEILDSCWQIYNKGEENVPVIFFDEFDCKYNNEELGWLKFFLSPMEDFKFELFFSQIKKRIDQQIDLLIDKHDMKAPGYQTLQDENTLLVKILKELNENKKTNYKKPIFVFAGGTKHSYVDFCREDNSWNEEQKAIFATLKGPDFVSRLGGHIDILGPNRVDDYDDSYVIRRAILLRSFLLNKFGLDDKVCDEESGIKSNTDLTEYVDEEIIKAMLKVSSFKYGARSMRAIINMSSTIGGSRGKIVSGTLPTLPQINMHVNGKEFLDMVVSEQKHST